MDRALTWFATGWGALAILVNVIAIIGLFIGAESFWAGLNRFWDTYSPFNLWNWGAELVLFSPAIGAMWWRDRRRAKPN